MPAVRPGSFARSAAVLACGAVVTSAALLGAAGTAGAAPAPKVPPAAGTKAAPAKAGQVVPASVDPFDPDYTLGLQRGQQIDALGTGSGDNPNAIESAGLAPADQSDPSSGFGTILILQDDGNLVEYETTTGAVLFNTGTTTGASLQYQDDGNVVLYDDEGVALFQTGTAGDTKGTTFTAYGNGQLVIQDKAGGVVAPFGTPTTSFPGVVVAYAYAPQNDYGLVVQDDGNVVAYRRDPGTDQPVPFWQTGTQGNGAVRFAAQSDGNLVVYSATTGRALWQTGTSGPGASFYQLDVQDDGNIVLYRTTGTKRTAAVWSSNTFLTPPPSDTTGK